MALYFLHLRDHIDELIDPEGLELPDMTALKNAVVASARDLMASDLRRGIIDLRYRIDAEDEDKRIVYSLPFKHAVSIIDEQIPAPTPEEAN